MKIKYLVVPIILCISTSLITACAPRSEVESDNLTGQSDVKEQASEQVESELSEKPNETTVQTENEPILVQIPAPSLSNNIIEEETEQGIGIYLPPSYYVSQKQYPVVYFLPGFEDGYSSYIGGFAQSMNVLITDQQVNEMIIVVVNGMNKLDGCFYNNSPVTGNWEDFVTKDVINYIDDNYRTIKSADARGIAGHSMGGSGVVNIAMHTEGVFGCAYSMSPGIFDENGLSKSSVDFKHIDTIITQYNDMDDDSARTTYLEYIPSLTWSKNFSFAYGSAFAGDPDTKAPYIKLPQQDANGEYIHDDVWELYEAGFGNVPEKLDQYKDNLLALKGFVIEYGTHDEFSWIPEGCEYFSEQLNERNIPHQLIAFEGNHQSLVVSRIKDEVLPFFSEMFGEQ